MSETTASHSSLLARVSFPLYTVRALSGQHILVAGGGGSAKTGVANGFQVFELQHNGVCSEAEEVAWYETGERAIMNCVAFTADSTVEGGGRIDEGDHVLAAGLDDDLQVYFIRRQVVPEHADGHVLADEDKFVQTRRRRKSECQEGRPLERRCSSSSTPSGSLTTNKRIGFDIVKHKAVKSDFSREGDDSFQKVVRVGRVDGAVVLATGGCDGHVRLWTYPDMRQLLDIAAHSHEVDDLDIDPSGGKIVSIGKDYRAIIWGVRQGKQITQLDFSPSQKKCKYIFKKCRFAVVLGSSSKDSGSSHCLFTINNSVSSPARHGYIVRWTAKTYVPEQHVFVKDSLSALAVSDDGRYLAVGSMDTGDVLLYISFSLQLLRRVERAHHMFVTGLEFLPGGDEARAISGASDASVVSISVDNQVKIHHIPQRGTISVFTASVLVIVVMVATFILCSMVGL